MSGNPFRLSLQPHAPTAAAPPPSTSFINTTDGGAPARNHHGRDAYAAVHDTISPSAPAPAQKTKKSVRIESPTETLRPPHSAFSNPVDASAHSPQESKRVSYAQHLGDPPPVSPAGFSDNFDDFEVDGVAEEDTDTRDMTATFKRSLGPEPGLSPSGAPLNPFARTLATMEPQERGSGELPAQKDRTVPSGNPRASIDVEGFKNMLLSGITSPRSTTGPPPPAHAHAPAPNAINPSVFESSSSTDTSSVSRQSIFEPVHEAHPESPRTSYEMPPSDDDQASLIMGEVNHNKKEKKKPPPAPKSRHGKLVSSRTPQVVSFESFSATEPTVSPPSSIKRANSDLNKPLPPPPSGAHIISQESTHESPFLPVDTKRLPPPVPLARRHSQLRNSAVGNNRSRSNSSLTISSQHSADFPPPSSGSQGLKEEYEPTYSAPSPSFREKAPPPPPPTRHRGAALSAISNSSANSSSTELSSYTATPRKPVTSPSNIPSSSRRTTLSSEPPSPATSGGLGRTSSINSVRTNHRAVSNESTGSFSVMPPPPPPPRRRQSGRSSLDKERPMSMAYPPSSSSPTEPRRSSGEYIRRTSDTSKRRPSAASESSLKYEYSPSSAAGAADGVGDHPLYSPREDDDEEERDAVQRRGTGEETKSQTTQSTASILDDMDRFQREIEELRAKYEHAA